MARNRERRLRAHRGAGRRLPGRLAPALALALALACAEAPRTLTSFHDTGRYRYLPLDMNGDSRPDYVQRLDTRTGWKDAFYLDMDHDGVFEEEVDFRNLRKGGLVHIVFAADGFPFRVFEQLRGEGYFRLFRSAGEMIAPYPSLTRVCWPRMLGLDPPPGYEARYFDPAENRMRKGPGGHVFPQTNRVISGLDHARAYVQVEAYAEDEMQDRYETAIRHGADGTILLYFLCTDAAGHRADPEVYREILIGVDRLVERLFYAYRCRSRLTLVSDHGNNRTPGAYLDLAEPLEEAGYREADRLGGKETFVMPRYGMIGIVAVYTAPENAGRMAGILSRVPGVNFCATWNPAGIHVVSAGGEAVVRWRRHRFPADVLGIFSRLFARGNDYAYDPQAGDPLDLLPVMEREAGLAPGRFAPEGAWLEATAHHRYPDPLRRLVDAFQGNVRSPATLLVDLADGAYASGKVHLLAHSAGTHGSLSSASSLGVVATNWCDVPAAVPADEVNRRFHILPRP